MAGWAGVLRRLGGVLSTAHVELRSGRVHPLASRTLRSDSPTYMFTSSGPFTLRKRNEHSVATALASKVFPVPGGPYRSAPLRWVCAQLPPPPPPSPLPLPPPPPPEADEKRSLRFSGSSMMSRMAACVLGSK